MNAPSPSREQLSLPAVLEALANPVRLGVVVRLARGEMPSSCGELLNGIPKSTASHHWRMLRDAGVTGEFRDGRYKRPFLRREDLDARFPGLLDAVIAGADDTVPSEAGRWRDGDHVACSST